MENIQLHLYRGKPLRVPLELKFWTLNYGNEIILYEIHNFQIGSQIRWLQFYYQKYI
jgi:hypothetical protein